MRGFSRPLELTVTGGDCGEVDVDKVDGVGEVIDVDDFDYVVSGKPDDGDAGPGVVPEGEEVDDGGDEQPAEQHPDGQARHVPCRGGDGQVYIGNYGGGQYQGDVCDGSVGHKWVHPPEV